MIVYVVAFANYDPSEVESIWATKALADRRAEELDGDWRVLAWPVEGEIEVEGEE